MPRGVRFWLPQCVSNLFLFSSLYGCCHFLLLYHPPLLAYFIWPPDASQMSKLSIDVWTPTLADFPGFASVQQNDFELKILVGFFLLLFSGG